MTSPIPVLPTIVVEAGFTASVPVGAGLVFLLGSATQGMLGTNTLGNANTWTDITQWMLSFTITRASTRVQGPLYQYQNSGCSVVLDNSDGRFDPDNLSGPYVVAGATQVLPMVPLRISATFGGITYRLFTGFVKAWTESPVTYEGGYSEFTVTASDAFTFFAGVTLPAQSSPLGAGDSSDARINRILNAVSWYTDHRMLQAGFQTNLQGTSYGDTALNLMQLAADAEAGILYVDGNGVLQFRNRRALMTDARSTTPQVVFGDLPGTVEAAGTEIAYASITRADDDTQLTNDVQVTVVGSSNLQEAQDATSIATFLFPRSYARTDLPLSTDADGLAWAQFVLYVAKNAADRFDALAIDPQADVANLWPQVLGREIGDRIQIWKRPPGVAAFSKDAFIAGISHSYDAGTFAWLTTWSPLQDALPYSSFWTLNDAVRGKLNSNVLAY